MSVEITVSWRFEQPDMLAEPTWHQAEFGKQVHYDDVPRISPAPDRVLPLGSSFVAPGLALFTPA